MTQDERTALIENNLKLAPFIAHKFKNTGIDIEDLISIGTVGLVKAANTFDTARSIKFSTYASCCIRNEILQYLRKHKNDICEISLSTPLYTDERGNIFYLADILSTEQDGVSRRIEIAADKEMIRALLEDLSERERRILELRYGLKNDGLRKTQNEIAAELNLSQTYISRIEKKTLLKLRRRLLDLH